MSEAKKQKTGTVTINLGIVLAVLFFIIYLLRSLP